ncbi:MAG: aldolase, partial [Chloroflexi bacterium]|nr:aldolase [Chloroflexota bacterium]
MNIGKQIRLNRIFSHPSGRLCSVAVDHFIAYGEGLPGGLRHIQPTLAAIVAARPDAVTMHRGIAAHCWHPHAGVVPLIVQSSTIRVDDSACEQIATPEDAVRLGADALAIAAFVRGNPP